MKLTTGLNILGKKDVEKNISKKIILANTSTKTISEKAQDRAIGVSSDPAYQKQDSALYMFNPDIRYRNNFAYSPLTNINYRNDLLIFAENKEIKKAVKIMANEVVVMNTDINKYPVSPNINLSLIPEDKQDVAKAMLDYITTIFYPKLYQMLNFKKDGLLEMIKEFLKTGKVAYEIIYDNLKNPKDIIGMQPIDPSTLQKVKIDGGIYYIEKSMGDSRDRVLHENQLILLEWNKYDYGYISYVDELRMSFNIMRSMQTSKILWFAAKSQVRLFIKYAYGDVTRDEAIQKLSDARNAHSNSFTFSNDGTVKFNNQPNVVGYKEYFAAETQASGTPEMEEINTQGPDLTEIDSLQYWERLFWNDTGIPYDRIDPNSSDSWGFADVENLRKVEVNFAKDINLIRTMIDDIFIKPIIIQLTLKEVEIGTDLSLIDSVKMKWIAFNHYEKIAELEVLNKKVEIISTLAEFGSVEDANGVSKHYIPLSWLIKNFLDFTEDQLKSMDEERIREFVSLGFNPDGTPKSAELNTDEDEDEDLIKESSSNIIDIEDESY